MQAGVERRKSRRQHIEWTGWQPGVFVNVNTSKAYRIYKYTLGYLFANEEKRGSREGIVPASSSQKKERFSSSPTYSMP